MEDFMKEEFDWKRFLLLNRKNVWKICLTAILGALLCGAVYWLWVNLINQSQLYQSRVLYAITFDQEQVGDIHDFYNDYTWNDILDTDQIAGEAAMLLEGITQEEIAEAANIPTMSDIKYIWVEVEWTNPQTAEQIQEALGIALIAFAKRTDGFQKIEIWDQPPTQEVNGKNYTSRVLIAGFVVFGIIGILVICYRSAMDDSVYTEAELERRFGILVAGTLLAGKRQEQQKEAELKVMEELRRNLKQFKDCRNMGVVFTQSNAKRNAECMEQLGQCVPKEAHIIVINENETEDFYAALSAMDAWILVISAGCHDGACIAKEWKNYRYQNCMPDAVILNNVERVFYFAYYHRDK